MIWLEHPPSPCKHIYYALKKWLLLIERTEYLTLTLNSTPWHTAELRGHYGI